MVKTTFVCSLYIFIKNQCDTYLAPVSIFQIMQISVNINKYSIVINISVTIDNNTPNEKFIPMFGKHCSGWFLNTTQNMQIRCHHLQMFNLACVCVSLIAKLPVFCGYNTDEDIQIPVLPT